MKQKYLPEGSKLYLEENLRAVANLDDLHAALDQARRTRRIGRQL